MAPVGYRSTVMFDSKYTSTYSFANLSCRTWGILLGGQNILRQYSDLCTCNPFWIFFVLRDTAFEDREWSRMMSGSLMMQEDIAVLNQTENFCHALAMLYVQLVSGERAVHLSPRRMMMRLSPFSHLIASGIMERVQVFKIARWIGNDQIRILFPFSKKKVVKSMCGLVAPFHCESGYWYML